MIGDDHSCRADVVGVAGFSELVTQTGEWIGNSRTHATSRWRVCWVNLDLNRVDTGRNYRLPISTVENEILSAELEDIGVGPSVADSLESVACASSTIAIAPCAVALIEIVGICVEHAESALRRFPLYAVRVDETVCGVVLKMEMLMACRELEQSVRVGKITIAIRIHVLERTSNEDVTLPDVRSSNGESNYCVRARSDSAFLNAAEVGWEILDASDPVILGGLAVDDEIRQCGSVDRVLCKSNARLLRRRNCSWPIRVDAGSGQEE